MANNYAQGTGVLVLKKVTPVIIALFQDLELEGTLGDEGEIYIARLPDQTELSWERIVQRLKEQLKAVVDAEGFPRPENAEPGIKEYLLAFASHFKQRDNRDLLHHIENRDFTDDSDVDLETLFDIARALDDGHGLKAILFETAFYSDRAALFEFGGCGEYYGKCFRQVSASNTAIDSAPAIDLAIEQNDLDRATSLIVEQINDLLDGVCDDSVYATLREKIVTKLASS